jgi:transcriptional regulator GlxA family with amidase domain
VHRERSCQARGAPGTNRVHAAPPDTTQTSTNVTQGSRKPTGVPPAHAWGAVPVHRTIDAMHAHPDHSFTPAGLAQIASCSLRSLQEGFRRYVGLTPMQYLRQIRLEHAHHDLAHAA